VRGIRLLLQNACLERSAKKPPLCTSPYAVRTHGGGLHGEASDGEREEEEEEDDSGWMQVVHWGTLLSVSALKAEQGSFVRAPQALPLT
jgi:hypothetical protein